MKLKEYLNSARKHSVTCETLISTIESLNHGNHDLKPLTFNLYYLTGYVIECSIKYGIYKAINYDNNTCVRKLDIPDLSFDKHIKHHRFIKYSSELSKRVPSLKLIDDVSGIGRDVMKLFDKWDAEVRYWYSEPNSEVKDKMNIKNVKALYQASLELMEQVKLI